MEEFVFNTKEEFEKTFEGSKDPSLINAVLNKKIKIKEPIEEDGSVVEEVVDNDVVPDEQEVVEEQTEGSTINIDEIEREKRYAELERERLKEESQIQKEQILLEKRLEQEAREKAEKKAQELEIRLKELEKLQTQESPITSSTTEEDDDEFASEYSKATRTLVEEMRQKIDSIQNVLSPEEIQNMRDKIAEFEAERAKTQKIERERKEAEAMEKRKKNVIREIEDFQRKFPELKTDVNIEDIHAEWLRFRKDIEYITKPQSIGELEGYIEDYYNNGKIKKLADEKGIREIPDYDKFKVIMNLIDIKNGLEYDASTGEHKYLKDNNGNRVNYRSIEEAYKISKYYDDLNEARINSYREVQQKMSQIQNAPVLLDDTVTQSHNDFNGERSADNELMRDFLNNPRGYANNPEMLHKIEMIYNKKGIDMPDLRAYRR